MPYSIYKYKYWWADFITKLYSRHYCSSYSVKSKVPQSTGILWGKKNTRSLNLDFIITIIVIGSSRSSILSLSTNCISIPNYFSFLIWYFRYSTKEITEFKKDLLLLGIISSSIDDGNMTQGKKSKPTERKNTRMQNFRYGQKWICRFIRFSTWWRLGHRSLRISRTGMQTIDSFQGERSQGKWFSYPFTDDEVWWKKSGEVIFLSFHRWWS